MVLESLLKFLVDSTRISTRIRRGFDVDSTSFRRRFDDDSTLSFRYRIRVETTRISTWISMRIRRGFDVVISTSNPRLNSRRFDEDSARNRWGFDVISTLSFRRRIHVETMRISMRFWREIDKVSTLFQRYHFDVESASKRRGLRRGFDEVSTSKSFWWEFDEDSMWIRCRFDVIEIFKISVKYLTNSSNYFWSSFGIFL